MNKSQANQLIQSVNKLAKKEKPKKNRKKKIRPKSFGCCLSDCAIRYLRCRENPYDATAACVPAEFNVPSQKVTYRARASLNVGTLNSGGVVFCPLAMLYSDGNVGSSDKPPAIIATGPTYSALTLPSLADVTAGTAFLVSSNTPWVSSDFANRYISARLVGAGIRVRNTTSFMLRGGSLVGVEDPQHNSIQGSSYTDIMRFETAELCNTDGSWNSLTFHPSEPNDLDFTTFIQINSSVYDQSNASANDLLRTSMGFLFSAPSGGGVTQYEFEAIAHFELCGPRIQGLTASPSDPQGIGIINSLTDNSKARRPKTGNLSNWVDSLLNAASDPKFLRAASGVGTALYTMYSSRQNQVRRLTNIDELD